MPLGCVMVVFRGGFRLNTKPGKTVFVPAFRGKGAKKARVRCFVHNNGKEMFEEAVSPPEKVEGPLVTLSPPEKTEGPLVTKAEPFPAEVDDDVAATSWRTCQN